MLPRCGAGTFSASEEKKIRPLTVGLTGKRYISRQRLKYLKGSELHVLLDVMLFTTPYVDPILNLHDISTAVFNLYSFFCLHLHGAISILRISNDYIKSTNSLKSFACILQQALLKCIISLHALYISRGSVWFGSGFHSVSINIQLLFVKGMYNPLKYIFGTSYSHLVLVQEYSWCHLGKDNKNLSQRPQKLHFNISSLFIHSIVQIGEVH